MASVNATPFESEGYWDNRYMDPKQRKGEFFDWYCIGFAQVQDKIGPALQEACHLHGTSVALVDVGCGNSPFLYDAIEYLLHQRPSESSKCCSDLNTSSCAPHAAAYLRFIATDFSNVVVQQQKHQLAAKRKAFGESIVVDVLREDARESIGASAGTVGMVVDKATLDAVDCSGCPLDAEAVVLRCVEALVIGGYFVSLTCRPVGRRLETIQSAMTAIGSSCKLEQTIVAPLGNDPIAPSHVLMFRRVE